MKKKQHGLPCPAARLTIIKYVLMTKLAIILIVGFTVPTFANSYGQNEISLNLHRVQLKDALKAIESQGFYRFVYQSRILSKDEKVSIKVENATINEVLTSILQNSHLTYRKINDKLIAILDAGAITENENIGININGKITDAKGKPVFGASIQEKGTNNGTSSKDDGSFSMT